MYTLYKFHFLNGISEINQLFDDILIIWPAPVYIYIYIYIFFTVLTEKLSIESGNTSFSIEWRMNSSAELKVLNDLYIDVSIDSHSLCS